MIKRSIELVATAFLLLMLASASVVADQTIYLIRHAEKVADDSKDPALTEVGQERAIAFSAYFAGKELKAVYSSDTVRTRGTAGPTAKANGLDVLLYDPRDLKAIAATVKELGDTVLIVGHSNTTAVLANILTGGELPNLEDHHYDRVYVIKLKDDGTGAVRIEHIEPLTP